MLQPEPQHEKNPWYKFWLPPVTYRTDDPPSGHTYIPLQENTFSAFYKTNINEFPSLAESLNATSFTATVNNASFALKTPFFKLAFIRCFISLSAAIWFINFIVACANGDIGGIIVYMIFIGLCPFGMRLGCTQHLERMHKYEKVLKKCCGGISNTLLSGSGYVVEPGPRCLWLDFHQGSYSPPAAIPNYMASPVYYYPGAQVGLST